MRRWLYINREGCWAHTLVQYAIIERAWGRNWRQTLNTRRKKK